jgi:Calx-beta domain/Domain of unknown function (DUF4114)
MAQLNTTAGDGGLNLTVDNTGSFTGALYDPVGSQTANDTTYYSDVAFRIGSTGVRRFISGLATNVTTGTGNNNGINTSSFTISGLRFDLVQSVSDLTKNGTRTGSGLTQMYQITNTTGAAIEFELVRYFDGDLSFDGSIADRGGRISRNGRDILFETDSGDNPAAPNTFVGITANGGTALTTNRFEIAGFGDLKSRILAGDPLSGIIQGDTNGDSFIDSAAYDLAPAFRNVFSLAAGATTNYVTETLFGTGIPSQVVLPETITVVATDTTAFENTGDAATFTLTRANGNSKNSITVRYTLSGSATSEVDYHKRGGTVTFAAGQDTATVTIDPIADSIPEGVESVVLTIDEGAGYNLSDRSRQARLTIADNSSIVNVPTIVSVNNVSFFEGNAGTKNVTFNITLNQASEVEVTVDVATADGTATAGSDYTALDKTTIYFAAGETSKQITVPIIGERTIEGNEAFKLILSDPTNATISANSYGTGTILDDETLLKFTKSASSSNNRSEVLAFVVDDDLGRINGIKPGEDGYLAAAIDRAQLLFSSLGNSEFDKKNDSDSQRYLSFTPRNRLEFFEIINDTLDGVKSNIAAGKSTANILFSRAEANPSGAAQVKFTDIPTKNSYELDFNDLVLNVEAITNFDLPFGTALQGNYEGQIIDLRDHSNARMIDLKAIGDASYSNYIAFYQVEDEQGTLANGLKPSDSGYAAAAIQAAVLATIFSSQVDKDLTLPGGKILAPVVVTNGTFNDLIAKNPQNKADGNIHAYFNYIAANTDKLDHIRSLGDNKFGVEDMYGGGDRDYNDLIFTMNVKS